MLEGGALPVVFGVNYKPYNTALLLQASAAGCDVVRGSEMLWEQGAGQFELWTGRSAPYGAMRAAVLEKPSHRRFVGGAATEAETACRSAGRRGAGSSGCLLVCQAGLRLTAAGW